MKIIKYLFLIILTVSFLFLVSCNRKDSINKTIVVGLDDNFPPMGFRDKNFDIVGFDIDMAKAASKILGIKFEFKPINWSTKEAELNSKRVDLLWNGLTITEDRKNNMLFSNPYMHNKQVIIVKHNSNIKEKKDLTEKIVGVQVASSSYEALNKDKNLLSSFKEIKTYDDNIKALMDLDYNRIDAVVADEVVTRYYLKDKMNKFTILDADIGIESYAVAMRKQDNELLKKINQALKKLKENGTTKNLAEKWFENSNIIE